MKKKHQNPQIVNLCYSVKCCGFFFFLSSFFILDPDNLFSVHIVVHKNKSRQQKLSSPNYFDNNRYTDTMLMVMSVDFRV